MTPISAIRPVNEEKQIENHLTFLKPTYKMNMPILNTVQDVINKEENNGPRRTKTEATKFMYSTLFILNESPLWPLI